MGIRDLLGIPGKFGEEKEERSKEKLKRPPPGNRGKREGLDETRQSQKSTTSAETKSILHGVKESPSAYPPLRSIAEGLYTILDNCERAEVNHRAIGSLAPRVEMHSKFLNEPIDPGDVNEKERAKKLERKLKEVGRTLDSITTQKDLASFLDSSENAQELNSLVEDVRDALMGYQTSIQQDINNKSCQAIGDEDRRLLNSMPHANRAGYCSGNRQGCLRGTREEILLQLKCWLKDEQDRHIFWLNGLAGTGKSTIAQTFAENSFADGDLGASFFCSRDFEDRNNLQVIFPTLAFQLAYHYPLFRVQLLQILRANPSAGEESLCSQMEKLIVTPLKSTHIQTLIIIDALDECKDKEPASALLSVLSHFVDEIPQVKFFITGRPEPRIRSGFQLKFLQPVTEVLRLHDVEKSLVDSDIKLFFRTQLDNISKTRSDCDFTEDWPSSSDIDILCKKAAGLFIYASTLVKFVASEYHTPTERLDLIISLPQNTYEGQLGIDSLYTQVLEYAFYDLHTDDKFYSRLRSALGVVVLVLNPLQIKAISTLLRVSNISVTLRSLHSLLLIPNNQADPIQVFHKSFPDFLMDPERCKDKRFFINPSVHHQEILISCLNLMKKNLKRNICNLDDYVILSEVRDISAYRKKYIGDALEYACQFWVDHLIEVPSSSHNVGEVHRAVDEFFTLCLLSWTEVLIIMGRLDVGVYAINKIQQWYTSVGLDCKWTDDSQRFILEYFDVIYDCPSQIYHHALPFSPSSSWLREYYSLEFSKEVVVVKGLQARWGTCFRTVSFDYTGRALACWKDLVIVGLGSGNIIILDGITGIQTSVLSGHTKAVRSLALSSDGIFLVSGSDDRTVKLWDIQTGGVVRTFHGHRREVYSVSISPDHTIIASGSYKKIFLWNTQTEEVHNTIYEHTKDIIYGHTENTNFVCFSPTNSQLLISASNDHTVKQWHVDGQKIGSTCKGDGAAFSPDGTYFVSWMKKVATVQSSNSEVVITKLQAPSGHFKFCCFSPDSKLIAGGAGYVVYVWNIASSDCSLIKTFIGHTGNITSLAFSSSLISSSHDRSIRFWQIGSSSMDSIVANSESISPNPAPIELVSLQGNSGIAISNDRHGMVNTWDISTGLCKSSFHTSSRGSCPRDVCLIDGKLICIWSSDYKIYIWDTEKGELLQTVDILSFQAVKLRVSGDGSIVFLLDYESIQAWTIWTGEARGKVELEGKPLLDSLVVDGSRVWLSFEDSETQGWDFGIPELSPTSCFDLPLPPPRPRLDFINGTMEKPPVLSRVEDTVTGEVVFWLSGRYEEPRVAQWDGRYLVAGYESGEVLILDFIHMIPQ